MRLFLSSTRRRLPLLWHTEHILLAGPNCITPHAISAGLRLAPLEAKHSSNTREPIHPLCCTKSNLGGRIQLPLWRLAVAHAMRRNTLKKLPRSRKELWFIIAAHNSRCQVSRRIRYRSDFWWQLVSLLRGRQQRQGIEQHTSHYSCITSFTQALHGALQSASHRAAPGWGPGGLWHTRRAAVA